MASHAIFFAGGAITGRIVTMNHSLANFNEVNAQQMLGHYTTYRDIALGAETGNYDLIANSTVIRPPSPRTLGH